ncbi:MAG: hypothetical protein EXR99_14760 [Gemmataceae bacterium]|nr:hypothetical protein [Gemmataceae bacterium]
MIGEIFLLGLLGIYPVPEIVEKTAGPPPFRYPETQEANPSLRYVNGLPVLLAEGSPEAMGKTVGKYGLKPAKKAAAYPREIMKKYGGGFLEPLLAKTGEKMFASFPTEYRKELAAIAEASGETLEDLILGNTLFDIKKVVACSGVAIEPQASSTGGLLLGRNLDYPSLGYIHQYTLVTVYRPEGKKAFASIGFPGLIGCLSGINQDGLCLAIHEVIDIKAGLRKFNFSGLPFALCYRKVLEECSTVEEALALLEKLPRCSTTNLLIGDRKRAAVFEVSPDKIVERKAQEGVVACCNHFCSKELRPFFALNVRKSNQRFATLEQFRQAEQKPGPKDILAALDKVNLGKDTLQTMLFESQPLRLHLSFGNIPASKGPFHTIDLAPLLLNKKP